MVTLFSASRSCIQKEHALNSPLKLHPILRADCGGQLSILETLQWHILEKDIEERQNSHTLPECLTWTSIQVISDNGLWQENLQTSNGKWHQACVSSTGLVKMLHPNFQEVTEC